MFIKFALLSLILSLFASDANCATTKKRPFYNIGHMVNNMSEINIFLDRGCNALEMDLRFNMKGETIAFAHYNPCDCGRECDGISEVDEYLQYTRKITTPGTVGYRKSYALMLIDLKSTDIPLQYMYVAGKLLVDVLYRNLFDSGKSTSKLQVLLSLELTKQKDFIKGFIEEMQSKGLESTMGKFIGWQISVNEKISVIHDMWEEIKNVTKIWYSHGITNCIVQALNFDRGERMIKMRDECNVEQDPYCPKKVYFWSVDSKKQLRRLLRTNVDGFITNRAKRLTKILAEEEFKAKFRLATVDDDAFAIFK
ncbi:sphingomyelinase D-like protein [Leptotrombidium deliense]|uniref:Sphingomyelinase D-like protein n=1 Tax=Leptotrombidium deliense TaxID=299467 RepID=A0A443S3R5_9ACAR|nr:sphingomyelinase D-like protein [Leptotrombidium deliense]